jgi:hypothetical protein
MERSRVRGVRKRIEARLKERAADNRGGGGEKPRKSPDGARLEIKLPVDTGCPLICETPGMVVAYLTNSQAERTRCPRIVRLSSGSFHEIKRSGLSIHRDPP